MDRRLQAAKTAAVVLLSLVSQSRHVGCAPQREGDISNLPASTLTPKQLAELDPSKIQKLPNGIPKILHQTWRSHALLPQHVPLFDSWDKFLPEGWLHVIWTDDEADAFVRAKAPKEFLETYDLYVYPIERIDTFRYVLLNVYGGVYADLDNELFSAPQFPAMDRCQVYLAEVCCGEHTQKQMDRYMAEVSSLTPEGPSRPTPVPVQNSLMVSVANHPFWSKLIHLAVERGPANNILQRWTGLHQIHKVVGVDLLSSANYLYGAESVCILEKGDWHGGIEGAPEPKYVKHHGTHVWKTFKHNFAAIFAIIILSLLVLVGGIYMCLRATGHTAILNSAAEKFARLLGSTSLTSLRIVGACVFAGSILWYLSLDM